MTKELEQKGSCTDCTFSVNRFTVRDYELLICNDAENDHYQHVLIMGHGCDRWNIRKDTDPVPAQARPKNADRYDLILIMQTYGETTMKHLESMMNISRHTLISWLKDLVDTGLVKYEGTTKDKRVIWIGKKGDSKR
jgi:hypothetical protein